MAIQPKNTKAVKKPTVEDEAVAAVEESTEVTATSDDTVGEVDIVQPATAVVDVSDVNNKDLVIVTMHETISPAPRIGTFDCRHRLGVPELLARKPYRVPKFVAEVLVDAGKAEIISIS